MWSKDDVTVRALKRLNLTRWIEKVDTVKNFFELIEVVDETLHEIKENDSQSNVRSLIKSINSEFIISVLIVKSVCAETLPLSPKL